MKDRHEDGISANMEIGDVGAVGIICESTTWPVGLRLVCKAQSTMESVIVCIYNRNILTKKGILKRNERSRELLAE